MGLLYRFIRCSASCIEPRVHALPKHLIPERDIVGCLYGACESGTVVEQICGSAENGESVIVKYLTSSKLTSLQLRDAAFRRTLLVQCLVLLHALQHPRQFANKPSVELKPLQVSVAAKLCQS